MRRLSQAFDDRSSAPSVRWAGGSRRPGQNNLQFVRKWSFIIVPVRSTPVAQLLLFTKYVRTRPSTAPSPLQCDVQCVIPHGPTVCGRLAGSPPHEFGRPAGVASSVVSSSDARQPLHASGVAPIDMRLGLHRLRRGATPSRGAMPSLVPETIRAALSARVL